MTFTLSSETEERRFDLTAAILGFVAAVLALPLRAVVSHLYADVLPPAVAIACLLYLLASRRNRTGYDLPTLPRTVVRLLPSLSFFLLSGLVVLAAIEGARTPEFLLLSGAVGSLVLVQLLFARETDLQPLLVLAQVLTLAFVVRFAALATTAGVIGIDTWTHVELVRAVRDTGRLEAMLEFPSRARKYYTAPLYHLLVLATAALGDLPLRAALYLSLGTAMALAPLAVYATARLFVNVRWALVASLLYAISDQAVRWSLNLIPTSMSLLLFLGALYLLVRVILLRKLRDVGLLSILMVALPLTHQVGAFVMLVLLVCAFLVQLLLFLDFPYRSPAANDLTGVLLFQLGIITFIWSLTPYRGGRFLGVVAAQLGERIRTNLGLFALQEKPTDEAAAEAASEAVGTLDLIITYIDVFGFVFMLAVGTIGALYVLDGRRASHATLTFVASIAAMAAFALVAPLFGIGLFLPGRWFAFMYALMVVVGVVGLGYIASHLDPRLAMVCFLAVVLVFPSAMLVASDATRDDPVFPGNQLRFGYTEAEVDGMATVGSIVPAGQPLWTDSPYDSVFRRSDSHFAVQGTVTEDGSVVEERVVYREYQTDGAPLFVRDDTIVLESVPRQRVCGGRDVLYDNGEVSLCIRR